MAAACTAQGAPFFAGATAGPKPLHCKLLPSFPPRSLQAVYALGFLLSASQPSQLNVSERGCLEVSAASEIPGRLPLRSSFKGFNRSLIPAPCHCRELLWLRGGCTQPAGPGHGDGVARGTAVPRFLRNAGSGSPNLPALRAWLEPWARLSAGNQDRAGASPVWKHRLFASVAMSVFFNSQQLRKEELDFIRQDGV